MAGDGLGALGAALRALEDQGMPAGEVRILAVSADGVIVRRLLELHRERLAEALEMELRTVDLAERTLLGSNRVARDPVGR